MPFYAKRFKLFPQHGTKCFNHSFFCSEPFSCFPCIFFVLKLNDSSSEFQFFITFKASTVFINFIPWRVVGVGRGGERGSVNHTLLSSCFWVSNLSLNMFPGLSFQVTFS